MEADHETTKDGRVSQGSLAYLLTTMNEVVAEIDTVAEIHKNETNKTENEKSKLEQTATTKQIKNKEDPDNNKAMVVEMEGIFIAIAKLDPPISLSVIVAEQTDQALLLPAAIAITTNL